MVQVRKMLGPHLALLMCAVLIAYPFGSCVAYLIITGACSACLSYELSRRDLWNAAWPA